VSERCSKRLLDVVDSRCVRSQLCNPRFLVPRVISGHAGRAEIVDQAGQSGGGGYVPPHETMQPGSGARPGEVTPDVLVALVAQEGRTTLEADPGATAAGRAELFSGRGSIEVERVRLP
jgi:hypothetical protein